MKEQISIPKEFSRSSSESFYISLITKYYIEHKSKIKEKTMSSIVEEAILQSEDFKEIINDFFEESKL